jgi:hypothetical protein
MLLNINETCIHMTAHSNAKHDQPMQINSMWQAFALHFEGVGRLRSCDPAPGSFFFLGFEKKNASSSTQEQSPP